MNRVEKIKLLREIENVCGYSRFKINKLTTDEEIDNALNYIRGSWQEYKDNFKRRVEEALE